MNALALIPARKGSKGIPDKNKTLVQGRELIRFTLDEAVLATSLSKIIVSSNDEDILHIAADYPGVQALRRPERLATDETKTIEVIREVLDHLDGKEPDCVVLLQATAPLRRAAQIDEALRLFTTAGTRIDSLASVARLLEPHPLKIKKIEDGLLVSFIENGDSELPRQALPPAYRLNGAIYIARTTLIREKGTLLGRTLPYIMDERDSINIDAPSDLVQLEWRLRER
jgi:CMP-N-acetylneuraminic acid synthetase